MQAWRKPVLRTECTSERKLLHLELAESYGAKADTTTVEKKRISVAGGFRQS